MRGWRRTKNFTISLAVPVFIATMFNVHDVFPGPELPTVWDRPQKDLDEIVVKRVLDGNKGAAIAVYPEYLKAFLISYNDLMKLHKKSRKYAGRLKDYIIFFGENEDTYQVYYYQRLVPNYLPGASKGAERYPLNQPYIYTPFEGFEYKIDKREPRIISREVIVN